MNAGRKIKISTWAGQALRLVLLAVIVFSLLAGAARAQQPAWRITFNDSGGQVDGYFDAEGNLALRGALTQNDAALAVSPTVGEWYLKTGGALRAMVVLDGAEAGRMRISGALHQGATPSASHLYRVRKSSGEVLASISAGGELFLSGLLIERAWTAPAAAPTLVSVSSVSESALQLTWTGVAGATGYRIERSPNGVDSWSAVTTAPNPLPVGATTYTHEGLATGVKVYYRVFAVNYGGSSPASNVRGGCPGGDYVDYAYDGWQALEEREDGAAAPARQYVYGRYLDEPLQLQAGGAAYYYHQNLNYSVVGLTNAGGVLVEAYEYTPYGQHIVLSHGGGAVLFDGTDTVTTSGTSLVGNPYLYTGRQFDPETGMYYYRFRGQSTK